MDTCMNACMYVCFGLYTCMFLYVSVCTYLYVYVCTTLYVIYVWACVLLCAWLNGYVCVYACKYMYCMYLDVYAASLMFKTELSYSDCRNTKFGVRTGSSVATTAKSASSGDRWTVTWPPNASIAESPATTASSKPPTPQSSLVDPFQ